MGDRYISRDVYSPSPEYTDFTRELASDYMLAIRIIPPSPSSFPPFYVTASGGACLSTRGYLALHLTLVRGQFHINCQFSGALSPLLFYGVSIEGMSHVLGRPKFSIWLPVVQCRESVIWRRLQLVLLHLPPCRSMYTILPTAGRQSPA